MKIITLISLLITSLAATADAPKGSIPAEYNPKYFSNHTENIWLFPDWPFYNPVGISRGDDVHVSNDNFATYKQGKLWSSVVDSDYQVVSVNGFDMPTSYQAWPTYRIDTDILNSYTHIRLADGSTPVEPPPVVEPEPPIVEPPPVVEEPEPPVTPEPEYPPVASFTYSPSEVFTDTVVTLDGSASENAVSYVWDDAAGSFGQWPLGEGQIIEFVFYNPGIKQPRLTVTNESGETHTMVQVFEAKLPEPEPPVIVEPEPEPEPEPPVIVEPEPEVPPVVEPINKAQLYGLMTRFENLLNTEDPRAAFSTAASMMRDKADLLERVGIMRQLISEAE